MNPSFTLPVNKEVSLRMAGALVGAAVPREDIFAHAHAEFERLESETSAPNTESEPFKELQRLQDRKAAALVRASEAEAEISASEFEMRVALVGSDDAQLGSARGRLGRANSAAETVSRELELIGQLIVDASARVAADDAQRRATLVKDFDLTWAKRRDVALAELTARLDDEKLREALSVFAVASYISQVKELAAAPDFGVSPTQFLRSVMRSAA